MTDRGLQNSGTTEVRPAHRFDIGRLEQWLAREVDGFAGPLVVEQFRGGQSNPTYMLVTPTRRYVLRDSVPLRIENRTDEPVFYAPMEREMSARVLLALCVNPSECPVIPPGSLIQVRLPPTDSPSGVKTRSNNTTEIASAGQASFW